MQVLHLREALLVDARQRDVVGDFPEVIAKICLVEAEALAAREFFL